MTNVESQMSNEIKMTKHEKKLAPLFVL